MTATLSDDRLDATYAALGDRTRRRILARLAHGEATVNELAAPFDMSLQAVSQHIRVLERAGLISRVLRPSDAALPARSGRAPRRDCMDRSAARPLDRPARPTRTTPRAPPAGREETVTTEFVISRVLNAPRQLVFDCLTTPENLTHFWGPIGTTAPIEHITVDLRPGGAFETVMVNEATGERYATHCVFTQIDPPQTIAWRDLDNGMVSTTTLTELENRRTEMRIHQTDAPEAVATPEACAGFDTSLDRFASYLATFA